MEKAQVVSVNEVLDDLDSLTSLIETCCMAINSFQEDETQKISKSLFFLGLPVVYKIQEKLKQMINHD